MADEKKAMAKDKPAGETAGAATTAPAVGNGVRIKAPAGMESISVGGLQFLTDGGWFTLPAALAKAAEAHVNSFEDAARREEKRLMADLEQLAAEADIPGRIKALEQRLAALEEMLGHGVSRG